MRVGNDRLCRSPRNNDHGQWAHEYGEIELDDFDVVLEALVDRSKGVDGDRGVFYDIGSGTGKCVMAAAVSGNFKKAVGIELVQSTHAIAECLMEECKIDVLPGLPPVELESRHASLFDDVSWLEVWVPRRLSATCTCLIIARLLGRLSLLLQLCISGRDERPGGRVVPSIEARGNTDFGHGSHTLQATSGDRRA